MESVPISEPPKKEIKVLGKFGDKQARAEM